ncbi:unnamed protein product [marine sediment metagenome]|uniref:Uncharacterized protein n=1 Tax=marine sediment metagenome TaxID=412755 RepID=X1HJ17_9ZZZZ
MTKKKLDLPKTFKDQRSLFDFLLTLSKGCGGGGAQLKIEYLSGNQIKLLKYERVKR